MQIHTLQVERHIRKKKKRVGRGGKRGTYSGRGIKGQKARAGRKLRPALRDIIKKIPKQRGYRFQGVKDNYFAVNVDTLDRFFSENETITPLALIKKSIIKPWNCSSEKVMTNH